MTQPVCETLKNPERWFEKAKELTPEKMKAALDAALLRIDHGMELYKGGVFPSATTDPLYIYPETENKGWTEGFWSGMLWLAYQLTGQQKYRTAAEETVASFIDRMDKQINVHFHDMGFLYGLSCVMAYEITGDERAKEYALKSADNLADRFQEKGQFIQAWGEMNAPDNYRLIIDCLMNLPLLFWATEQTGKQRYTEIAKIHLDTTLETIIRPDGTTFHTFFFDPETGARAKGVTAQGYADDSCWARGQSWAVYGLMMDFERMGDYSKLPYWYSVTNVFLNRSPSDLIAYWDLIFTDGSGHPRDTSASAIAACGLMRAKPEFENYELYQAAAKALICSLIDNYTTAQGEESTALLSDGICHWKRVPTPEGTIFGDYYYLEALAKYIKPDVILFR
ncbi:MAG TPA: glycoside hydrolase family 88 protein [Oscillospiraceae bacterium]|nr:glycoside hydrolase family 88 protein [Oscillospiraceae bacterium]HPF55779.1 glycoside hydrolase family 88 protein [Clostridiales bacterium]HPK35850.1 glycoside hydrolase family 88 protein [Oscillospiraceae bacterium]HPR76015.1 glycoside hydrolase family 88 protein [Oscillospiraceae bacterium]